MSIRPFRDINRKITKEINVGEVKIGGNNPVSVQSMTNTVTKDIKKCKKNKSYFLRRNVRNGIIGIKGYATPLNTRCKIKQN